jgi:hypothetical protein
LNNVTLPDERIIAMSLNPALVLVLYGVGQDIFIARWSEVDEHGIYSHTESIMFDRMFALTFCYLLTGNPIFGVLS